MIATHNTNAAANITSSKTITHHNIVPLDFDFFARQFFAFQFQAIEETHIRPRGKLSKMAKHKKHVLRRTGCFVRKGMQP